MLGITVVECFPLVHEDTSSNPDKIEQIWKKRDQVTIGLWDPTNGLF